MGSLLEEDPTTLGEHAMSHDGPSLDLDLRPVLEPLSPPPTLAVSTRSLPTVDLGSGLSSDADSFAPGPRLPSPTDDDASLPPSKRLRRETQEIFADSLHERSPTSPESSWGYRSEASGSSSASCTFYDHDSTGSGWSSDNTEMDYSPHSTSFHDLHSPGSPLQKALSLDPPLYPGLSSSYSDDFSSDAYSLPSSSRSKPSNSGLLWSQPSSPYDLDMAVDFPPLVPSSPRTSSLHLPFADPESELSYTDTVMPEEDEDDTTPPAVQSSTSSRQPFRSLPDYTHTQDLLYLTPAPRSPHASLSVLPDLDMNDVYEVPSSPHSPHSDLPELPEDELFPSHPANTVSPSILSPAPETPNEGLGLFIQSDPPLRRSPSPDDDALQFLDIQFDPAISNLDVDEFLALRSLRKRALEAEREARMLETTLNERVTNAATALLPSSLADAGVLDDPIEKRARKHELHVAMDLRNEARKDRKREKQKSKEIGALLDYKMHRGYSYSASLGLDTLDSVRQLVASMMMRRQETCRALSNRKSAVVHRPYQNSPLSISTSYQDLLDADWEIE